MIRGCTGTLPCVAAVLLQAKRALATCLDSTAPSLPTHPSPAQPSKHIPFQAPAVVKKDLEAANITA